MALSKCSGLFFLSVSLDHALECALGNTLELALENTLELAQLDLSLYELRLFIGCSLDVPSQCSVYVSTCVFIQSFVDASVACHFFLDCETPETTHKHTLAHMLGQMQHTRS